MGVAVKALPGKGRGLVTTTGLPAGSLVLDEPPQIVTVSQAGLHAVCAECLRTLPAPGHLMCQETGQACFCSDACRQGAEGNPGSHSLALRRVLARVPWDSLQSPEEAQQVRFVMQALAVRALSLWPHSSSTAAEKWRFLSSLSASPAALDAAGCDRVTEAVNAAMHAAVSPEDVSALLSKEVCNSFGFAMPRVAVAGTEPDKTSLRGSALFALASCINHECAPTAARVDDPDEALPRPAASCPPAGPHSAVGLADRSGAPPAGASRAAHMRVRLLQDLPAGEEVVISYMPLLWDLRERQARCAHVYGFTCTCPRCKCESVDDPSAIPTDVPGAAGHDDGREPLDPSYSYIYLFKYSCPQASCGGTMVCFVPGTTTLACNVCNTSRTDSEFVAALEADMEDDADLEPEAKADEEPDMG